MATAPNRPEVDPGPQRTCVGCRTARPQRELMRVVRLNATSLAIGRTLSGRGAWLCRSNSHCLDLAQRQGGFSRSFRAPISAAAVDELRSSSSFDQQG